MTLKKAWGTTIAPKTAARGKDEFQIIVKHWELEATEDSWEKGEIGGRDDSSQTGRGHRPFSDIQDFIKGMQSEIAQGIPKGSWYVYGGEPGRIGASWSGDKDGFELSRQEQAAWKSGEGRAWTWDLSVWVQVGRLWTPTDKELIKITKLPAS